MKKIVMIGLSLALLMVTLFAGFVYAAGPTYFDLTNATFMGRTNFALYQDDGTKLSSTENIRYAMVFIWSPAYDDESIIMYGNWSANQTTLDGGIVLLWKSQYGPWGTEEAYDAHNMSACIVPSDYQFLVWGLQGNYNPGFFGYSKPYLTLSGLGVEANWETMDVSAFGSCDLRGRLYSYRNGTLKSYKTSLGLQLLQIAGAPHWNCHPNSLNLKYEPTGSVCVQCLVGDGYYWLCEWIYQHTGVMICGMI